MRDEPPINSVDIRNRKVGNSAPPKGIDHNSKPLRDFSLIAGPFYGLLVASLKD
jgi:hypothetical protein